MTIERAIPDPPSAPGPLDLMDSVYRALLEELVLCSAHRRHLTGASRGFTPEQIERRGYRSMPSNKERRKIVDSLLERFTPEELVSVPGFVVFDRKGTRHISLTGSQDAILCPIRDQQDRIISFQVRDMSTGKKGKKKSKYVIFSSRNAKGKEDRLSGPSPAKMFPYPVHVSRPAQILDDRVWITEGIFKADYAADHLGAVMVSVLGVSQFRRSEVDRLCLSLAGLPSAGIVLAYDADKRTKRNVGQQESKLIELLTLSGLTVEKADWDEKNGKGLDDLLRAGGVPEVTPADPNTSERLLSVPGELVDAQHPEPPAESSLTDAQNDHKAEVLSALQNPESKEQIFLESDCGTGKTHGVMSALEELSRSGDWRQNLRVLYVVDTKEQIEKLHVDFPWLKERRQLERLTIRTGRSASNCEMVEELPQMREYGRRRQSVATNFCSGCACRKDCKYQAAIKRARKTSLTIATKDAMFNSPSDLKSYSVIIIDEDLLSACLFDDTAILRPADIDQWTGKMDRIEEREPGIYPKTSPLRFLLAALSEAIQSAPEDKGRTGEQYPLIGRLEAITGSPEALRELVESCREERLREPTGFAFERSFKNGIPLRLCGDLLDQLDRETDGEHAYTKLWVNQEAVQLAWLRVDALEALMGRTLINLDATPAPHLIDVFPNARIVRHNPPSNVRVHQITDALYTRSGLRKDKTRNQVSTAADAISGRYERPVLMTYKEFSPANPAALDPLQIDHPDAVHGYFGRHDRALNVPEMMQADAMVIAGTPYDNIAATRRMVHALLFDAAPRTAPAPLHRKTYLYKDEQGYGRARKLKIDPDPHVQAAIDHQVESRIWQSIGRLRAVRRPGELIAVWLLTAYPVKGLPVVELKKMYDVMGAPPQFAEMNEKRADEYRTKAAAALAEMEKAGEPISRRTLRAKIGGSDQSASRVVGDYKKEREIIGGCGTHSFFNNKKSSKPPVCTTPPNKPKYPVNDYMSDTYGKSVRSFWVELVRKAQTEGELEKIIERVNRMARRGDLSEEMTEEILKWVIHRARALERLPQQNVEPEFLRVMPFPRDPPSPERGRRRQLVATLPEELREEYEERAAMIEQDAGFSREEAEKLALAQLDDTYRIPRIRSCFACGRSEWWLKRSGQWICGVCHPQPIRREARVASG